MKYNLQRFKSAQENVYSQALIEITRGRKVSHWMWFIFPQITGLGKSTKAKYFEIQNIEEAKQFLLDDTLGRRLIELTEIMANRNPTSSAKQIFGFPDYLKFHSSMTLFFSVIISDKLLSDDEKYSCIKEVLRKY